MSNFIVIGSKGVNSGNRRAVFGDIVNGCVADAVYLGCTPPTSGLARTFYRFCTSPRLNRHIANPLRNHWEIGLRQISRHIKTDQINYLIFCPGIRTFERIPGQLPEQLQHKYAGRVKLIFYLIDGVERTARVNHVSKDALISFLGRFDACYTYDANDAIAYGFPFVDIPVWRDTAPAPEADDALYFCGSDKKRGELICSLYSTLTAAGVNCRYHIVDTGENTQLPTGVHYQPWLPYADTVAELRHANCLLELLADQNSGPTLRYKEAVMYNKKLLSNNPDLSKLPYYNPRWMRYFKTVSDIDLEWLKRVESVDYGYRGEFSAERFLKTIEALNLPQ